MEQTLIIEGTGAEVARVLEAMPQQRFRATALPDEAVGRDSIYDGRA